jgi:hypothetical protein
LGGIGVTGIKAEYPVKIFYRLTKIPFFRVHDTAVVINLHKGRVETEGHIKVFYGLIIPVCTGIPAADWAGPPPAGSVVEAALRWALSVELADAQPNKKGNAAKRIYDYEEFYKNRNPRRGC